MSVSFKYIMDFIILMLIYIFYFYKRWKMENKDILFVKTILYIYISVVLYFTLMPIVTSLPFVFNHPYVLMNLVPFIDVMERKGDFVRQVGLNVLMMIPFGILFPMTNKKNDNFLKVFLCAFFFSFIIEVLQPLINGARSSDVTDIITNVLGAVIGYGLYILTKPVSKKLLKLLSSK